MIKVYYITVGYKYKITEPNYDDYDEGILPETNIIEVISKTHNGYIFKDIEHGFTYERTNQHLSDCIITQIN